MARLSILTLAFVLFLATGIAQVLDAQGLSPSEKQKIEVLIKYVGEMNDAKFVRNGSTYNAKTAETFLRLKWAANDYEVKTARDFINKIVSVSGTSGEPYVIRFKSGSEVKSQDLLLAELNKIKN